MPLKLSTQASGAKMIAMDGGFWSNLSVGNMKGPGPMMHKYVQHSTFHKNDRRQDSESNPQQTT